jgi:1-acyl-sn-glycerol-3-phosphate acyltransferase
MFDRCWRIFATGFCFTVFGVVGVFLSIFLMPIVFLTPSSELRKRAGKKLIKLCFSVFLKLMQALCVLELRVEGQSLFKQHGMFVLANHPTLIDVVILIALIDNPDCIIKRSLLVNPFTLGLLKFAGFIENSEGPKLVVESINSMNDGNNLIIFPEGTRTKEPEKLDFKRGASNIALRGSRNITPVLILCSTPLLRKGDKWYRVPHQRPIIRVVVRRELDIACLVDESLEPALQSRLLTRQLENYFQMELVKHEPVRA